MKRIKTILLPALVFAACNNEPREKIAGTYVREWTAVSRNMNTGSVRGKYCMRDTIFIKVKTKGYEVSNSRWRKNLYDKDGWRDQSHAFHRPMPTYTASYDKALNSLDAGSGFSSPLYLDPEPGLLYTSSSKTKPYHKVKR